MSRSDTFLEKMVNGPRIIIVTGHFGSGKTEFSVSLAYALGELRRAGDERLKELAMHLGNSEGQETSGSKSWHSVTWISRIRTSGAVSLRGLWRRKESECTPIRSTERTDQSSRRSMRRSSLLWRIRNAGQSLIPAEIIPGR